MQGLGFCRARYLNVASYEFQAKCQFIYEFYAVRNAQKGALRTLP